MIASALFRVSRSGRLMTGKNVPASVYYRLLTTNANATITTESVIEPKVHLDVHYQPSIQVPYKEALAMQRTLQQKLFRTTGTTEDTSHIHDALLLLEHPSVYTLGRRSTLENIKFNPDDEEYDLIRCERGGEVTCKC
jgi:lipoate-protein ligase B